MGFVNVVSALIMSPVLIAGGIMFFFLSGGILCLIFGKVTMKEILESCRFSDNFLNETRKYFWCGYSPLLAVTIMFRIVLPFEDEKYYGYVAASIISYILVALLSGYIPKKKR